jgi:hypothetical protein
MMRKGKQMRFERLVLDSGYSIDRCRMDIKNRRNLADGLPFRDKAPGQFTLIQSKLARPSKTDTPHLVVYMRVCAKSRGVLRTFVGTSPRRKRVDEDERFLEGLVCSVGEAEFRITR